MALCECTLCQELRGSHPKAGSCECDRQNCLDYCECMPDPGETICDHCLAGDHV